jgi:hypothetical protein
MLSLPAWRLPASVLCGLPLAGLNKESPVAMAYFRFRPTGLLQGWLVPAPVLLRPLLRPVLKRRLWLPGFRRGHPESVCAEIYSEQNLLPFQQVKEAQILSAVLSLS